MTDRQIQIVHAFPPNFEMIKACLPYASEEHVFCYGDTIYVPDGHELRPDVIFHESLHTMQQGKDPEAWWNRYLIDPAFRLDQEMKCYCDQYKWLFTKRVKYKVIDAVGAESIEERPLSRSFLRWARESMATALAGPEYGNLIGYTEAERIIRKYVQ